METGKNKRQNKALTGQIVGGASRRCCYSMVAGGGFIKTRGVENKVAIKKDNNLQQI